FATDAVGGAFSGNTGTPLNLQQGDVWISFDGGWDGLRTITAQFDPNQGSATMYLYNNALAQVAVSVPVAGGAQLQYSGISGAPYFLKITGTNTNVTITSDPPSITSAGPLGMTADSAASPATSAAPASNPPSNQTASSTSSTPSTPMTSDSNDA